MPETIVETMIEADALRKIYGRFAAVDGISFRIRRGEITAFLGPNGAGKSTTMKMLTGYLTPTSGVAKIAGFDMSQDRCEGARLLGYLPENGPLYPDMTPRALLRFRRGLESPRKELPERIDEVTRLCDLGSVLNKPIGCLSKEYGARVG